MSAQRGVSLGEPPKGIMMQVSLFDPAPCPCGGTPAVLENDIILWCLCDLMVFSGETLEESMRKYNDWTAIAAGKEEKK